MNTATIESRAAPARATGTRTFYLVADHILPPCGKLGYRLLPCAECGSGFRPGRPDRVQWLSIPGFFADRPCRFEHACRGECPLCDRRIAGHVSARAPCLAGLVWAPLGRYPDGRSFTRAIHRSPIAWPIRCPKPPPALVIPMYIGTPILLGHARGILDPDGSTSPSIIAAFIPSSIVYVPGPTDRAPYLRRLRRLGVELGEAAPAGVP